MTKICFKNSVIGEFSDRKKRSKPLVIKKIGIFKHWIGNAGKNIVRNPFCTAFPQYEVLHDF